MRRLPIALILAAALAVTDTTLNPSPITYDALFPFCFSDFCLAPVARCDLFYVYNITYYDRILGWITEWYMWYKCERVWSLWEIYKVINPPDTFLYLVTTNGTSEVYYLAYLLNCTNATMPIPRDCVISASPPLCRPTSLCPSCPFSWRCTPKAPIYHNRSIADEIRMVVIPWITEAGVVPKYPQRVDVVETNARLP